MRILHLTTFLQGGAGRVIVDLALEQHRAGHEVRVVASESGPPGYGNYPAFIDHLTRRGVPIRLVDSMFERRYAANLAVVHVLEEIYDIGREPHVIHAHAAVPSMVGLLFAGVRRASMRIVQTMHGWGVVKSAEQVTSDASLLNLVDQVVVPSKTSMLTLESVGVEPSRITVVPYGVGADSNQPDERDHALIRTMAERRRDGALVTATVGTISARKKQTLVVEAAARASGAKPFVVFVGDGDDRDLRDVIERSGTGASVHVHGYSSAARRIAAKADVLVLPSESEGQPLSILEAFADGVLVVASDIPELAELVDEGVTGFRAAAGQPEALARVLEAIARMPLAERRAVCDRARACHRACFSKHTMVDAYSGVYQLPPVGLDEGSRRHASPAA